LADHRFVAVQEHGHRGCVFTSTRLGILIHCIPVDTMYQRWLGASQPSHRVAGRPHKHVAEWRPRDHAASQPRGRASGFVRGRPARGPRAALRLQLPLRRSSTSQRWRRPRPRGSASAGAGTGLPTGPTRTLSPLASARPAPCLYSHRPALQWGGGGKVVCINIICDTDKLTSGVKGPEFDSRSPP
jgi:hypothetical protein